MITRHDLEEEILNKLKSKNKKEGIDLGKSRIDREFVESLSARQLFNYKNIKLADESERISRDEYVVHYVFDCIAAIFECRNSKGGNIFFD